MKRSIPVLITLCFISNILFSQYQIGLIPRTSPDKKISQKIGYTDIEITYGSPSVNDRTLWGDLVPYDKVWRAGANNATTIHFSGPVEIHGNRVDSGTYSLFLIPRKEEKWTYILNKQSKQWGAFRYDQSQDQLRVDILPRFTHNNQERLTYQIYHHGYQEGRIALSWGNREVSLDITTDYIGELKNLIVQRAAAVDENIKWIVYLQGAEHLIDLKSNLELAEDWLDMAKKHKQNVVEWNKQFYPQDYVSGHLLWTQARLMSLQDNNTLALQYVEEMKKSGQAFYKRQNQDGYIDDTVEAWKEQK